MTNHEKIKSAFGDIKAPEGFAEKTIKNAKIKKTPGIRPVRRIIAIAATIAILATASLAAANYFGSFDRLRGIIGDEQAEGLAPVGLTNETGAQITNDGVLIENKIGSLLTEEGIKIEIVAVGVDSNTIDYYFTIEDLTGNRLEGDIWINATIFPNIEHIPWNQGEYRGIQPEIIDRSEDGVVTLRGREVFEHPVTGYELRFNLYDISYNLKSGEYELDIDLASLENHTPAAMIEGTPVLPVGLHNIEFEIDGIVVDGWYSRLSSIGFIDGKLHVQQWLNAQIWDPPDYQLFRLVGPDGNDVIFQTDSNWYSSSFTTDEYGSIIAYDKDASLEYLDVYREYIYQVNSTRLSEYKLIVEYLKGEQIDLRLWYTTFTIGEP